MEKGDAMRARGAFRDEGKVIKMFDAIIRAGIRLTAKAITLIVLGFGLFAILSLEGCGSAPQDAVPADAGLLVPAEETVETLTMDDGSEIVGDSEGNVVSTSGGAAAEYVASHGSSGVSASKVQSDTGRQVSSATTTKPVTRPSAGGAPVTSGGGQASAPSAPAQTQPSQPQAPTQAGCSHSWQPVYENREVVVVEAYDYQDKVQVGNNWECHCGTTFSSTSELYAHQGEMNRNGISGHGSSRKVPIYETKTVHVPAVTETQPVHVGDRCSKCGATK